MPWDRQRLSGNMWHFMQLIWEVHVGILEFLSGGVKVSFFLVLSLFYRSQMVNFKEIYHFPKFQRESNIFQGVQLFTRGVQLHIPYRNPYNLWFSKEGLDPLSPHLDPHLRWLINVGILASKTWSNWWIRNQSQFRHKSLFNSVPMDVVIVKTKIDTCPRISKWQWWTCLKKFFTCLYKELGLQPGRQLPFSLLTTKQLPNSISFQWNI